MNFIKKHYNLISKASTIGLIVSFIYFNFIIYEFSEVKKIMYFIAIISFIFFIISLFIKNLKNKS